MNSKFEEEYEMILTFPSRAQKSDQKGWFAYKLTHPTE